MTDLKINPLYLGLAGLGLVLYLWSGRSQTQIDEAKAYRDLSSQAIQALAATRPARICISWDCSGFGQDSPEQAPHARPSIPASYQPAKPGEVYVDPEGRPLPVVMATAETGQTGLYVVTNYYQENQQ